MADLAVLVNRQLKKVIEQAIGNTEEAVRQFGESTYDDVISRSPRITFYYVSNHRINIIGPKGGGQPKAKLEPPIRESDTPGIFAGNLPATVAEEKAKLANFRLGDSIRISTGVPYAEAVERNHGVYSGAEVVAGAAIKRLKIK